jgi:hypothetical protein
LPGTYKIALVVDGKPAGSQSLTIVNDPRSKASEADLRASFELQQKTRALIDALHTAVDQIRSTRAQMAPLRARNASLASAIDAIDVKMSAIEGQLVQVKLGSSEGMLRFPSMLNEQLDVFRGTIEGDRAPTRPQLDAYAELAKRTDAQVAAWKTVMSTDVAALNKKIVSSGVALIDPAAPLAPAPSAGGKPASGGDDDRDRF